MDSENRAHNYWLLIAQFQKIGVLLVEVPDKDACNLNGKPSNPPSLISLTYFHYFDTLLIPPQELTFSWKPVTPLGFYTEFWILYTILSLYYLSPPIYLEIDTSHHKI